MYKNKIKQQPQAENHVSFHIGLNNEVALATPLTRAISNQHYNHVFLSHFE